LSLPPFDIRGLLPPVNDVNEIGADRSPYFCSMTTLCSALGTSDHRKWLLRNLINYRSLIASDDYIEGIQFIDGSFVEDIEKTEDRNPNDIDVFSILIPPAKYGNANNLWKTTGIKFFVDEIIDNTKNKSRYNLDCYGVLLGQQNYIDFLKSAVYWYSLFSHKKVSREWKGFVAVPLNANDDLAALATL
jgi:hypothetical protein